VVKCVVGLSLSKVTCLTLGWVDANTSCSHPQKLIGLKCKFKKSSHYCKKWEVSCRLWKRFFLLCIGLSIRLRLDNALLISLRIMAAVCLICIITLVIIIIISSSQRSLDAITALFTAVQLAGQMQRSRSNMSFIIMPIYRDMGRHSAGYREREGERRRDGKYSPKECQIFSK